MQVNGFVFLAALIAFCAVCMTAANSKSTALKIILLTAIVIGMLSLGSAGAYGLGGFAIGLGVTYIVMKMAGRK